MRNRLAKVAPRCVKDNVFGITLCVFENCQVLFAAIATFATIAAKHKAALSWAIDVLYAQLAI